LEQLIIAIDPDTEKSGVAYFTIGTSGIKLKTFSFFDLLEFLKEKRNLINMVIVEASWLIKKSNWHSNKNGSNYGSAIGARTGANHETGKKIVEMLEYLKIPVCLKRPLKKVWKGSSGKISHKEFIHLLASNQCEPIKRSNQEERDSFLLLLSEYQNLSKRKIFKNSNF